MNLPVVSRDEVREGNGNPSSICVWEIPWTDVSGSLQSKRSQEVRYNLVTKQRYTNVKALTSQNCWNTKDKYALLSGNLLFFKMCSCFTNLARY